MRQIIETIVNHLQRIAQILLAALASRQIRKVGCDARLRRWLIVFIETNTLNRKCKLITHDDLAP